MTEFTPWLWLFVGSMIGGIALARFFRHAHASRAPARAT